MCCDKKANALFTECQGNLKKESETILNVKGHNCMQNHEINELNYTKFSSV